MVSVNMGSDSLEVVDKYCCLGDTTSGVGGMENSTVARIITGGRKFKELLALTSRGFSVNTKGNVCEICVGRIVLYESKTVNKGGKPSEIGA